jgi:hypothetical protein
VTPSRGRTEEYISSLKSTTTAKRAKLRLKGESPKVRAYSIRLTVFDQASNAVWRLPIQWGPFYGQAVPGGQYIHCCLFVPYLVLKLSALVIGSCLQNTGNRMCHIPTGLLQIRNLLLDAVEIWIQLNHVRSLAGMAAH